MRISLVNLNLVADDVVDQCLLHQLRFHRRRKDEVIVYVQHPVEGLPADATDAVRVVGSMALLAQQDEHFATSDLYVFHYTGHYDMRNVIPPLARGGVIFYDHNVTPPESWSARRGQAEHSADQAAVGPLTPIADLIITDSPLNAEELATRYAVAAERVRVLPPAVPLDRFHPGPADLELAQSYGLAGKNVLLYVGRVADNTRVDLLVEALAQVRRHVKNTVLLVVGDHDSNPGFGETMAQIHSHIHALKLDDAVIFTGRVADLPPYYRLADIYVSASPHEGFGVPLIQAMASGLAVIATRTGLHPWVVDDAGLLVSPGKPNEMAHHIVNLLRNDMHLGELSRHGLRRAQDFSPEAYAAGWGNIIDDARDFVATRPAYPRLAQPPQPDADLTAFPNTMPSPNPSSTPHPTQRREP